MPDVTFKPVTKFNWNDAMSIKLRPDQQRILPSAVYFLARAYVRPDNEIAAPFVIYEDNKPVGFFCLDYNPDKNSTYWLCGFMIDKKYQRQGYGKAALIKIVDYLKTNHPNCNTLGLTVDPRNIPAQNMYKDFGFTDTGDVFKGELIWKMALNCKYS